MLKLAIPNGSLENMTLALLSKAGIRIEKRQERSFLVQVEDKRISRVRIIRPQQIPYLVERGGDDIGICGLDCVKESEREVVIVREFCYSKKGFQKTKVVLFASVNDQIKNAEEIPPFSEIISEYPNCTRKFFEKINKSVKIDFSYGSTEAYVPYDYRFGVCVTETGFTLKKNDLKIIAVLFESPVVLIANKKSWKTRKVLIEEIANLLTLGFKKMKK